MAWLLVTLAAVLAVLVAILTLLVVRLTRRIDGLEARLAPGPSSDPSGRSEHRSDLPNGSLDEPEPAREYVITRLGEAVVAPETVEEAVPARADAGQFADILLRETVVQTASWAAGVRRALAPETRNRIWFEMRREVKRSRRQRKLDTKLARREWAARQRAAMAADEQAAGSAA